MSWLDDAEAQLEIESEMQEAISGAVKWSPEAGDILKGTLIEAKFLVTKFGPTYLINVMDPDSKVWTVWCGSKLLNDALMTQHPEVGKGIAIVYKGKKQGKENEYHDYTMSSEPAETREQREARADFWRALKTEGVSDVYERNEPTHTKTHSEEKDLEAPF